MVRLRPRLDKNYVTRGRTVLATASGGFLHDRPEQGLFVHEMRLLSRYRYTIQGLDLFPRVAFERDATLLAWLLHRASARYELSQALAERVLLPAIREASGDTAIVADGFGWREQIEQGAGLHTLHIAELAARRLRLGDVQ